MKKTGLGVGVLLETTGKNTTRRALRSLRRPELFHLLFLAIGIQNAPAQAGDGHRAATLMCELMDPKQKELGTVGIVVEIGNGSGWNISENSYEKDGFKIDRLSHSATYKPPGGATLVGSCRNYAPPTERL